MTDVLSRDRSFASDNYAGAHQQVIDAVCAANDGHARGYGDDPVTGRAIAAIQQAVGAPVAVGFVFNGTGANVTALGLVLRPWQAVVCAAGAHIDSDEAGAPARLLGTTLLRVPTTDGRITPAGVQAVWRRIGDEHAVQPTVVSITQSTEWGTCYALDDIAVLAEMVHERGGLLHIDGARLANAAATLDCTLAATTFDAGADLVSLGGTKNGLLGAEAVLARPELAADLPWLRKSLGQLASKHRFLAAQFEALFTDELWRHSATHANAMAERLHAGVRGVPGLRVTQPRQANAVFAILSAPAHLRLQQKYAFYLWNDLTGEVRWMCAWDTHPADVDRFIAAIRVAVAADPLPVDQGTGLDVDQQAGLSAMGVGHPPGRPR